jgi:hypothetical protein
MFTVTTTIAAAANVKVLLIEVPPSKAEPYSSRYGG